MKKLFTPEVRIAINTVSAFVALGVIVIAGMRGLPFPLLPGASGALSLMLIAWDLRNLTKEESNND